MIFIDGNLWGGVDRIYVNKGNRVEKYNWKKGISWLLWLNYRI